MSTTLYVLLTSAILLGVENGDVSQAVGSAVEIFKEYMFGYIIPLIFIAIFQWLVQRLPRLSTPPKLEHMQDDRRRLVRLLAETYFLSLSTVYAVDETSAEFQSGILHAAELVMEVRVFGWVVCSWRG